MPGAKKQIMEVVPDKISYAIAKMTLDVSYPHIPLSKNVNSGRLRLSSLAYGVKSTNGNYSIGSGNSQVNYARYVWRMGKGTKWSTPNTYGRWYEEVWKKRGNYIARQCVERYKLK